MKALVEIRDELAVARDLAACVYYACSSTVEVGDRRSALSTVLDLALQQLNQAIGALDDHIDQRLDG